MPGKGMGAVRSAWLSMAMNAGPFDSSLRRPKGKGVPVTEQDLRRIRKKRKGKRS